MTQHVVYRYTDNTTNLAERCDTQTNLGDKTGLGQDHGTKPGGPSPGNKKHKK
jgi:hypothetical protein